MSKFPIFDVRQGTSAVNKHLFFNSAGSSLPSDKSINIIKDYIDKEAVIGGYDLMAKEHDAFQEFYSEVAKLIKAKSHNIAFATSATSAFSQALYSINWVSGDVILTSKLEYASNILSILRIKERYGIEIQYVDCQDDGLIDMNALESSLKKYQPKVFLLTHIPTNTGVIQDAKTAGALCKEYDCIYILDACQSIGQLNVDVNLLQCDFLSVTGRKFLRGPRGSGFLFVSDKIISQNSAPICIDLAGANWTSANSYEFHNNARRWELWEKNYSTLLGLTQSIREINDLGIENIEQYNNKLQTYFRSVLQSIDGIHLVEESDSNCCIITWRYKNASRSELSEILNKCEVIYSMAMKESALVDMNKKGIDWAVRFSPHYFNTESEIDVFKERFLEKEG
jgi:selenocysteine lyase/cysteine desulfurase